jgi:hypothetical protein
VKAINKTFLSNIDCPRLGYMRCGMGFVPVLLQSTVLHTASKEQALGPLTRSLSKEHAQPKQCDEPEDPAPVVLGDVRRHPGSGWPAPRAPPRTPRHPTPRRPGGVKEPSASPPGTAVGMQRACTGRAIAGASASPSSTWPASVTRARSHSGKEEQGKDLDCGRSDL